MSQKFRETHLFAFLNCFDDHSQLLDSAFSDYLRAHKSIGAHDRRFIGDTAYVLILWKGLPRSSHQKNLPGKDEQKTEFYFTIILRLSRCTRFLLLH